MLNRRAVLGAPLALAAGRALLPSPALAQAAYPTRPVRLIVPYAPGGAVDITGRQIAERLTPTLGQNVIVENRGGAGGNLGADAVAKAAKDGYTILLSSASIQCANKFLYRTSMPFDPIRDFAPLTRVTTGTILLMVNGTRPWKSFGELIEAARKDPGKLTMGSSGTGTISHLAIEKVKKVAGVDITHIPYRGGGPAFADLLAGTIDMCFDVIPAAMPHIRSGAFRPLAVGSAERLTYVPELVDVPGMNELLPGAGIDFQSWYAMDAPAGTPPEVVRVLHDALVKVVGTPEFRARFEPTGMTTIWDETPDAYGRYKREQEKVWQDLVAVSGATLD
ncbi:tripartite tricarboxylate transporter substrate binding protein [Roseomonas sp. NAR14]|uniref:Tripartite tricarboxylate transporter substrate binding protein n=1 Tax=Roseomonas acroporae TaxID=2937791 RepID=A0A9X1YC41_9PROT|nr:tripartite tricarboxylate transporter substrate binding protein [Roseomonas acroporae]MCK8783811.1 tripartite tricarboxylate transporter substrate binding protein [Roseomonas acroporae]